MNTQRLIRLGTGWGACLAVAMVAACSDTGPTVPSDASQLTVNPSMASLSFADVIVAGTGADAGAFTNTVVPFGNIGRLTGAFWDNPSVDGPDCNIGFYVTGTMTPGSCLNNTPAADANQGGGYTKYWGDNGPLGTSAGRDPASFMFKGTNTYIVTLLGSYAGGTSEVGWFTKVGGVYQFYPIADWGSKIINSTATIATGGVDWGLFIHNTADPLLGGCDVPSLLHDCSDATGGFTEIPFQQFSLFAKPDASKFLVGAEDNHTEIASQSGFDADYQDYIFSVTVGGQGCSPGYWKNHNNWPSPYTKTTLFSSVFENAFPGQTLQQVLENNGGGLNALGRQLVSALLNAQQFGASNFGMSAASVISGFNAVYPGTKPSYTTLQNALEALTDIYPRVCPLN